MAKVENFTANWAGYYTPSFLFLTGDRGDHWSLLHPRGFGQLLPEQAPLILIALAGLRVRGGAEGDRARGMAGARGDSGGDDGAVGRMAAGGGRADAVGVDERQFPTFRLLPVSCLIILSRGAISWR